MAAARKARAAAKGGGRRLDSAPTLQRYLRALALATGMVAVALFVGVLGYRYLNDEIWIDALVDASMILGGMGPVAELHSTGAKLFASFYAIFSGLFLIGASAVVLSPWVHRLLHSLHADDPAEKKG